MGRGGRRTLSRERPGGRDGEEGSSRPRGFFGLGGAASDTVVAAAVDAVVVEVVEVDGGVGGATRSEGDEAVRESLRASQLATHGRVSVAYMNSRT